MDAIVYTSSPASSGHALLLPNPSELKVKNSSGDEIANVNFLRLYRTRTSKYQKWELTSFNKLDDS